MLRQQARPLLDDMTRVSIDIEQLSVSGARIPLNATKLEPMRHDAQRASTLHTPIKGHGKSRGPLVAAADMGMGIYSGPRAERARSDGRSSQKQAQPAVASLSSSF